jgi:hypothetical protein
LPQKKGVTSREKEAFEESGRYTKQESSLLLEKQFGRQAGELTAMPKEQLVLPLISQKRAQGMLTERRSLGGERRNMYKL